MNIGAAVALAAHIDNTSIGASGAVMASTNALTLSGKPGQHITSPLRFTNASGSNVTLTLAKRSLTYLGNTGTGSVTLDPSVGTSQPTFQIWSGAMEIYQKAQFNVFPGTKKIGSSACGD